MNRWHGIAAPLLVLISSSVCAQAAPARPSCRDVRCTREPDRSGSASNGWLLLPRAALAPARLAFRTTTDVLMIVPRVEDEHHLSRRLEEAFFNDPKTFGIYPTAFYETGLEPNAGVRLVHRDLFGAREHLRIRAGFGGWSNQLYEIDLRSGRRWTPLALSIELQVRTSEDHDFFGAGNGELTAADPDAPLRSPTQAAIQSEYGAQELRARGGASWTFGKVRLGVLQLWRRRELSRTDGDDPSVPDVYAGDSVALFDHPLVDVYDEASLTWDGRRARRPSLPRALPSTGGRLVVWSGAQHELRAPRLTFGRLGFDAQRFIDLYRGDRVLRLRLRSAWVVGPLDRIPFLDLPQLGGSLLLRGYDGARFRGRGTVLASVEYRYPVQQNISGYLFVDAGRAYLQPADVSASSMRGARVGFGGGVVVFDDRTLFLRVQLASSIDGGLFFALRLDATDGMGSTY